MDNRKYTSAETRLIFEAIKETSQETQQEIGSSILKKLDEEEKQ